jgi:hypothetical protein
MTDCTERHTAAPENDMAGEGQKGMPRRRGMTDRTEPHLPHVGGGRDGEGQEGMPSQLGVTDRTGAYPAGSA